LKDQLHDLGSLRMVPVLIKLKIEAPKSFLIPRL
jgi:hypothetical protein